MKPFLNVWLNNRIQQFDVHLEACYCGIREIKQLQKIVDQDSFGSTVLLKGAIVEVTRNSVSTL